MIYSEKQAQKLRKDGGSLKEVSELAYARMQASQAGELRHYVETGYEAIDSLSRLPRNLAAIGARPGMGKSLLSTNIALKQAMSGEQVGLIVLEDDSIDIADRAICALAQINNKLIHDKGKLTAQQKSDYFEASEVLSGLTDNLFMRNAKLTTENFAKACEYAISKYNLDVLHVDHIHRLKITGRGNPALELEEAVNDAADAALGRCALVCYAQLNRDSTKDMGAWPNMAQMKQSGGIEQAARLAGTIHRPEHYDKLASREPLDEDKNHMYLKIEKVTAGGETGIAKMGVNLATSTVFNCRCRDGIICSTIANNRLAMIEATRGTKWA